jgi:hypothetical protein
MDPDPGGPKTCGSGSATLLQCCGSGSAWICIDVGRLDLDPVEQNIEQKKTSEETSCFEVLGVLFEELVAFPVA